MRAVLLLGTVLSLVASLVVAVPASVFEKIRVDHIWDDTKIRGVNLGGWLVLEPFITPSIFGKYTTNEFMPVDEWTLCQRLGKEGCFNALKSHWDNFVMLEDFEKIKKAGFNVVRIPIGYWAYWDDSGAPYTSGQAPYLEKAIEWARKTDLKVVIDLHGAPRSQNGFDHSGQKLEWPQWGQGDSIARTHQVLKTMEEQYANKSMQDVVIAIQPLNEPYLRKLDSEMVKQFYRDSYYNLRLISDTPIMLHDGFWGASWLNSFLSPSDNGAQNVIVDNHYYQIFDATLLGLSSSDHRSLICNTIDSYAGSDKWTVVGEWSGAMTDCAPHLNGFNMGSRYEGKFPGGWYIGSCQGKSGSVYSWSQEWKDDVRRYIETQLDAYERFTNGWFFWNFKTEGDAGEWDLFQLLDNGVFPSPPDDRKFGKYCSW